MNILIGADPEVFVTDKGSKVFRSAHGLIPGSKENPFRVECGAVQVDGMALEFNIDPARNADEFTRNIQMVMGQLAEMVPDYDIHCVPTAKFSKKTWDNTPKEAKIMGCDPDFNAWEDGAVNPKPNGEVDFRTAAGHIHIGWTKDMDINDAGHREACIMLTKQLDVLLGIPSLLIDKDTKRRQLYGQFGSYRVKPYGVEYRVLSNFWLKSPELMRWVYKSVVRAFYLLTEQCVAYELPPMLRLIKAPERTTEEDVKSIVYNYGMPQAPHPTPGMKKARTHNKGLAYNVSPIDF